MINKIKITLGAMLDMPVRDFGTKIVFKACLTDS